MSDLFGYSKVDNAINILKEFEPEEGYYLAFSGGKDSIVIYDLAVKSGVKFDAHYNYTVDPPELVYFIRKHYPQVQRHLPVKSMWKLIVEKRMPPTRLVRYCCEYLKEAGGNERKTITGIRAEESCRRKRRQIVESCYGRRITNKILINPILDWTTQDVWQYIRDNHLPYCSLYDEGWKRVGCLMCPQGNRNQQLKHAARYPRYKQLYIHAFDRMLKARERDGLPNNWRDGNDVWKWWTSKRQAQGDPDQYVLFE